MKIRSHLSTISNTVDVSIIGNGTNRIVYYVKLSYFGWLENWPMLYFLVDCRSESPSQVFVQIVNVLYMETAHMTPEEQEEAIKKYIISYDNICHLDKLKAAQQDLPLPSPLNKIWKLVTKIIDRLHIRNHKDKQCQQKYNPENVLTKKHNTMAAEQLFSWASRFKKIVNMMTQSHHMFYLHRMFQRRNKYTGHCRQKGIEPLLPNVFEKDSSNWTWTIFLNHMCQ